MTASERTQLFLDLRSVMSTEAGRRVIGFIMHQLGALRGVAETGSIKDGLCAALHDKHFAGRRQVALELHDLLFEDDVTFQLMGVMEAERHQALAAVRALSVQSMSETAGGSG